MSSDLLVPFVPAFLLDWRAQSPDVRHRSVEGTLAFVDISGFTTLTERLARRGKIGAEELTSVLDATFGALLDVAYEHGAWLVKWGGDAVLLLFQGEQHAARACTAAIEMRVVLDVAGRLKTTVGPVRLRISTGIHTGTFDFLLCGSSHAELVLTGHGATTTVQMEAAASASQVAVSPETAAHVPAAQVVAGPDGALLLARSPHSLRVGAFERKVPSDPAACLPAPVRAYLLSGELEADHRVVVVAFVEFAGVGQLREAEGPGAVAAAVDTLVSACQDACDRHGVTFWETDVGRDGGKVMLVAGAPVSSGVDADAVLEVAREVLAVDVALRVRVGVNGGRVFFGGFGPPYRRTLSVKGDAVNLAARLMARAGSGELLASTAVLDRARTAYDVRPLPPFLVKGRSTPVHAAVVLARTVRAQDASAHLPLLGRTGELVVLREQADLAATGVLRAVEVVGEAGAGASRLLQELAGHLDVPVLATGCDPDGAATAYAPVRRLLAPLLGRPAGAAALEAAVEAAAPDLVGWTPLVGAVLGVAVPDTQVTAALDGRFRAARQHDVVVALLRALVPGPAALLLDDAQYLDEASGALLSTLVASAESAPWLVVVVRRADAAPVLPVPDVRLDLRPLDPDETLRLLHALTEDDPLPPHEARVLVRRSGGNPLFLHGLVAGLKAGGGTDDLPDTVEGVVAAQVQRLPPPDRALLRAAAVLGTEVDTGVLRDLAARIGVSADDDALARLAPFVEEVTSGRLRFRRALVREAAYEGLAFSRRVVLHGHAAEVLRAQPDANQLDDVLSLHFARAQRWDEAVEHALVAGALAQEASAIAQAAELYDRALDGLRRLGHADERVRHTAESLGDVRYRLGDFAAAVQAYRTAGQVLGDDLVAARLQHKAALAADRQGDYRRALSALTTAERLLGKVPPGTEQGRLLAQVFTARATVKHWQGRSTEAVRWCRRAVAEAEQLDAPDVLADALVWLDACLLRLGQGEDGADALRGLQLWLQVGDQPWHEGRTLNALGIRAYFAGRWDDAVELYGQSQLACERAGDAFTAAVESANRAEVLSDQGHLALAEPLLRDALRVWRASSAPSFIAFGHSQLGRLAARAGRYDEALRLLAEARETYVADGEQAEIVETDARVAECLLLAGRPGDALEAVDRVLAAVPPARQEELGQLALLRRVRALALAAQGRTDDGIAGLEESVATARTRGATYELALGLRALLDLHASVGAPTPDGVAEEQAALFAGLGIVDEPG